MFLNLLGNIFASREANFVSATMFPRVGKQGNIWGNIADASHTNVSTTMFPSLPMAYCKGLACSYELTVNSFHTSTCPLLTRIKCICVHMRNDDLLRARLALASQSLFALFELSRILHEGRQYPKNGGFWPSWETLIPSNRKHSYQHRNINSSQSYEHQTRPY
jgi:hypothetical protein